MSPTSAACFLSRANATSIFEAQNEISLVFAQKSSGQLTWIAKFSSVKADFPNLEMPTDESVELTYTQAHHKISSRFWIREHDAMISDCDAKRFFAYERHIAHLRRF